MELNHNGQSVAPPTVSLKRVASGAIEVTIANAPTVEEAVELMNQALTSIGYAPIKRKALTPPVKETV